MLASNLQILTRLSHPPETKRLIGGCRAPWSKRALGAVEGAQLTALQPIWKQPITDVVTLHQSQTFMHCSVALSLSTAYHKHLHTAHHTSQQPITYAVTLHQLQTPLHCSSALCKQLNTSTITLHIALLNSHSHTLSHSTNHKHRCIAVLHSVCQQLTTSTITLHITPLTTVTILPCRSD